MMQRQELYFTARKLDSKDVAYQSANELRLACSYQILSGAGTIKRPYCCEVTIQNQNPTTWEGIIHVSMRRIRKNPQVFMPGFMYGTNRGDTPIEGRRACPRIRRQMAKPASPWWMVRGDKLSHPVAMIWDDGRVFGFHAAPYWTMVDSVKTAAIGNEKFYQYAGYTCNNFLQDNEVLEAQGEPLYCEVGYTLGYENAPWLFVEAADVRERSEITNQCFRLEGGETVKFCLFLYDFAAERMTDINRVVEDVYHFYHEEPRKKATVQESVKALAEAVSDYAWISDKHMYSLFVFNKPGSEEMELRELGSFSWTNGLSIATPMLMSAVRLSDDRMKQQTIACIDQIVKNSLNPSSGLPFDGYMNNQWTVEGWWFDCLSNSGHVGYIVGQGVYYLLKAYEFLLHNTGEERPEWLAFAKAVILVLEGQRNSEGEYPYILSAKDGAGLEYDSLGSAWCMTAALKYVEVTGDRSLLPEIRKSEQHYYDAYVAKCQCYGGPLDISKNMDSEGILAYIRGAAMLHKLTGEEQYLTHLRDGIEYELTFKFCYNSPVQVPPLSKVGWCSCGGSITSVVNPHIHPMSSSIVEELNYYVKQTKDSYIASRMRDTILWGCQTYNHYDREYDYGKKGWMSERYCYSQGLVKERYPSGELASTWFALMPWASASVLEGIVGEIWEDDTWNQG